MADQKQPDLNYMYYDNSLVPAPFGMNNTGATCWFNTLLQCLFSCPAFNRCMLQYCSSFCDLGEWYKKMLTDSPDKGQLAQLSGYVLGRVYRQLGYSNEGSTDGLHLFIQQINSVHMDVRFYTRYEYSVQCKGCGMRYSYPSDTSFPLQLLNFDSGIKTREAFCDYLRNHTNETEKWTCACGHINAPITKYEKLVMVREIIPIIFHKNTATKWYPRYLAFSRANATPICYQLVAKVLHSGMWDPRTSGGGHYYAHCYRKGEWYTLNDSSVSPGNGGVDQQVVMLYYHMTKDEVPEVDPNEVVA